MPFSGGGGGITFDEALSCEQTFKDLGIIGGSTGMLELPCSQRTTLTTPNIYRDTIGSGGFTASGAGLHIEGDATSEDKTWGWWLDGVDGSTVYTKVLAIGFQIVGLTRENTRGLWLSEEAGVADDTDLQDNFYLPWLYPGGADTSFYKRVNGTFTNFADEASLIGCGNSGVGATSFATGAGVALGLGLYCDFPGNIQKAFMRFGSGSTWFEVMSTTDASLSTGAKSFGFIGHKYGGATGPDGWNVAPLIAWGVEA